MNIPLVKGMIYSSPPNVGYLRLILMLIFSDSDISGDIFLLSYNVAMSTLKAWLKGVNTETDRSTNS